MDKNRYYQNLSAENRKIFLIRTLYFYAFTYFTSERNYPIEKSMEFLISSAFVQITFGLNVDLLNHFKTIVIVPESYSYRNTNKTFNGDVNPKSKKISLVWPVVEKGFSVPDDALNLSIHEFGHVLIIENSRRSYLNRIFPQKKWSHFKTLAKKESLLMKNGKNRVLRSYGATNLMEFFAVSLETFFEKPYHFSRYAPELYKSLCELLNQNPLHQKDPVLKKQRFLF